MPYVTILQGVTNISEEKFLEWFDAKDVKWWNETHGLCPTGQYDDQDDESDIRAHISTKITEVNETGTVCSDGCVGTLLALTRMIAEYLIERGAKEIFDREIYSSDHLYIIK